jgi:hypothetical protein
LTIYYCEAVKESLCFIDQVSIEVPVTVAASGATSEIVLDHSITPPQLPASDALQLKIPAGMSNVSKSRGTSPVSLRENTYGFPPNFSRGRN